MCLTAGQDVVSKRGTAIPTYNRRNNMIKQIKDTGGDWPTTKEILVNNYLHIFVNFVKSIDFTDLQ